MKKIIHLLSSILITLLPAVAFAQPDQYVWHESFSGMSWNQFQDKIHDVYIDDDNNTYIAGEFTSRATLKGRYICPPDSGRVFDTRGVFVAKFDSVGNLSWCKSAKGWKGGNNKYIGSVFRDGKLYLLLQMYVTDMLGPNNDWLLLYENAFLHFFDTTFYSVIDGVRQPYGELPLRTDGTYTYLVTFDTEGKRIDTKIAYGPRGQLYNQDSHGNHYILEDYRYTCKEFLGGERDKKYVILNDDSTCAFEFLCPDIHIYPNYKSYSRVPLMIKIDSAWTKAEFFQLTDSNNGFINEAGDSIFGIPVYSDYRGFEFKGFDVDEKDNFYISATTQQTESWIDSVSLPLKLYFSNGLYYEVTTWRELYSNNFLIKIDTMGNAIWLNQMYHEDLGPETILIPNGSSSCDRVHSSEQGCGQVMVDSSDVFYVGYACADGHHTGGYVADTIKYPYIFFDRERTDTLTFPIRTQWTIAYIAVYDRTTGEHKETYVVPDSVISIAGDRAHIFFDRDHIVGTFMRSHRKNFTLRWNRNIKDMQAFDMVKTDADAPNPGVWGNRNGYIAKVMAATTTSYIGDDFHIPSGEAAIAVYYDSLLDQRRHNRDTTHTPDDTATASIPDVRFGGDVRVSPNPTDDAVAVKAPCGIRRIDIHDIGGRLVASHGVDAEAATVHLGGYPQGVYLLKIHLADGRISMIKVLKK